MASICADRLKLELQKARFVAVSVDKVTGVNNQQWLSCHEYTSSSFSRQFMLLCICRTDQDANDKNLYELIFERLQKLAWRVVAAGDREKLISFGADGASVFQGTRSGVTTQLKQKETPCVLAVHDKAHKTNLVVEALSNLRLVQKLENLCKSLYSYFSNSPKRQLEFTTLAEGVKTEDLKSLNKVATRWFSLLDQSTETHNGPVQDLDRQIL